MTRNQAMAEARRRWGREGVVECESDAAPEYRCRVGCRYREQRVAQLVKAGEREMSARELARPEAESDVALDEIRLVLREAFVERVENLAAALATDRDGSPRVFRDHTLTKLQGFLMTFTLREWDLRYPKSQGLLVTRERADSQPSTVRRTMGDDDLAALVLQAEGVLQGVTPDALRNEDTVRGRVREGIAALRIALRELAIVSVRGEGGWLFQGHGATWPEAFDEAEREAACHKARVIRAARYAHRGRAFGSKIRRANADYRRRYPRTRDAKFRRRGC